MVPGAGCLVPGAVRRTGCRVLCLVLVIMMVVVSMIVCVLVDAELGRRHAGAQHAVHVHMGVAEREGAERAFQLVERQAGIQQGAERHVTGDAGETVEIQDTAHSRWDSLKLQYRTSPSTM